MPSTGMKSKRKNLDQWCMAWSEMGGRGPQLSPSIDSGAAEQRAARLPHHSPLTTQAALLYTPAAFRAAPSDDKDKSTVESWLLTTTPTLSTNLLPPARAVAGTVGRLRLEWPGAAGVAGDNDGAPQEFASLRFGPSNPATQQPSTQPAVRYLAARVNTLHCSRLCITQPWRLTTRCRPANHRRRGSQGNCGELRPLIRNQCCRGTDDDDSASRWMKPSWLSWTLGCAEIKILTTRTWPNRANPHRKPKCAHPRPHHAGKGKTRIKTSHFADHFRFRACSGLLCALRISGWRAGWSVIRVPRHATLWSVAVQRM